MENNKKIVVIRHTKLLYVSCYLLISFLVTACTNDNDSKSDKEAKTNQNNSEEKVMNSDFELFVNNFTKVELPFIIKIQDSREYDPDKLKWIDTAYVNKYISVNNKYFHNGHYIKYYYVHSFNVKSKVNVLLYYQSDNDSINQYILNIYNQKGQLLDNIEFSGIIGDVYELDGTINEKSEIELSKLVFEFSPKYPEIKEFKEVREVTRYKIDDDGKIKLTETLPKQIKVNPNK